MRRRARDGSRRGGARDGAGRKPNVPGAPGVSHRTRAALSHRHPVHVTLRVRRDVPNLRRNAFLPVLTDAGGTLYPSLKWHQACSLA